MSNNDLLGASIMQWMQTQNALKHNTIKDAKPKYHEGMLYYDPATLRPMKYLQQADGTWSTVPAEDYKNCKQGMSQQNSGSYCAPSFLTTTYGSCATGSYSMIDDTWTGMTASNSIGNIPHVSYEEDTFIYYRYLYQEELKKIKLKGIGINDFGLKPTTDRNDSDLCKEIVNKFKIDTMATNFEQRLQEALKRKKEIEQQKQDLFLKLTKKKTDADNQFKQRMVNLAGTYRERNTGYEQFINELNDSRYAGNKEDYLDKIKEQMTENALRGNTVNYVPKQEIMPPKEKTDKDYVDYFIAVKMNWYGVYQKYGEDIDGLQYIDFQFEPSLNEDDERLDIFEALKGRGVELEYKVSNDTIREMIEDKDFRIISALGNVLGNFAKKKTFVKVMRVYYATILEKAKEEYGK